MLVILPMCPSNRRHVPITWKKTIQNLTIVHFKAHLAPFLIVMRLICQKTKVQEPNHHQLKSSGTARVINPVLEKTFLVVLGVSIGIYYLLSTPNNKPFCFINKKKKKREKSIRPVTFTFFLKKKRLITQEVLNF